MSLRALRIDGCDQLTNLSPLTDLAQLERLTIPTGIDITDFLPRLPKPRKLGTNWPTEGKWQQIPTLARPKPLLKAGNLKGGMSPFLRSCSCARSQDNPAPSPP